MRKFVENIKKAITKFIRGYMNCMKLYGEALLRGGSCGCV